METHLAPNVQRVIKSGKMMELEQYCLSMASGRHNPVSTKALKLISDVHYADRDNEVSRMKQVTYMRNYMNSAQKI